jgi:hypothetical protein
MGFLKPYSTLLVGIALGVFVVPKVTSRLGVSLPGV